MIPLGDEHGIRRAPVAGCTILALCVLVFLLQLASGGGRTTLEAALAFIPAVFFGHMPPVAQVLGVAPTATVVTHMFLHGSWLHLAANMLYLWVFGDNVEEAMGQPRFVAFFLASGAAAALAQGLPDPQSTAQMFGASGGVSGVLGACLVLFPRYRVNVLVPVFLVVPLLYEAAGSGAGGGVAFRAHIGGFVAGAVMAPFFCGWPWRRRGVSAG